MARIYSGAAFETHLASVVANASSSASSPPPPVVQVGVLLGSTSVASDGTGASSTFILGHVPTPQLAEDAAFAWTSESAAWVAEHARMLEPMLCGGVCIVGLYVVGLPNAMEKIERNAHVQAALESIAASPASTAASLDAQPKLAFACAPSLFVVRCPLRVENTKAFAVNAGTVLLADLRFQQLAGQVHVATASLPLALSVPVPANGRKPRAEAVAELAREASQRLWQGLILMDNQLVPSTSILASLDPDSAASGKPSKRGKKGKKSKPRKKATKSDPVEHEIAFLSSEEPVVGTVEDRSFITLRGQVALRAICMDSEPAAHLIENLLADLERSIATRIDLAVQDEEDDGVLAGRGAVSRSQACELPRRAALDVACGLTLSHYAFQDESLEDVAARFTELTGVAQPEVSFLEPEAHLPVMRERPSPAPRPQQPAATSQPVVKAAQPAQPEANNTTMVVAIMIALVAMGIGLFFMG